MRHAFFIPWDKEQLRTRCVDLLSLPYTVASVLRWEPTDELDSYGRCFRKRFDTQAAAQVTSRLEGPMGSRSCRVLGFSARPVPTSEGHSGKP